MEKLLFLVILTISVIGVVNARWLNKLDQQLYFSCPPRQSIYRVRSEHHNREGDRYFDLRCRPDLSSGNCYWTGYLNFYDGPVSYNCGNNGVISGMFSVHNNRYGDRVFKVKCCRAARPLVHCYQTPYVNSWDGYFDYNVYRGQYLHGIASVHNNYFGDRRFRFTVCRAYCRK